MIATRLQAILKTLEQVFCFKTLLFLVDVDVEPHHVKPHPLLLEVNIRDPDLPPAAWAAMAGGKTGGERSKGGHAGQVSPFHTSVLQDGHLGIFVRIYNYL